MSVSQVLNTESSQASAAAEHTWIYRPSLDLIVGCGAWSVPLLLLIYPFGNSMQLTVTFYALALLFNGPHYMATIYRAYHTREDFTKYKIFTLHLTVLLLLTAILTHWSYRAVQLVYTIYFTWSPWHYSGQNFGLTMMFARRSGAKPTRDERNALYLAFLASYVMVFFKYNSTPAGDPYFLSIGLPLWFGHATWFVLFSMFMGLGLWSLVRMIRQTSLRAMIAPITLFSTQLAWFFLPDILEMLDPTRPAPISYNGGLLAFMHCSQYLWITSYYARREAQASNTARWRPLAYFGMLVIGGIALFVPAPWAVSYVFRYDFNTTFLIFASLVNIHHFLLDGAIWKLRDGRIAALLLDLREKTSASAEGVGAAFGSATRWMKGSSFSARALRIAFMVVLLVLAGLDQTYFYLGLDGKNLQNLLRAEALNPYSSPVQVRIAWAERKAGNTDQTIAALQQAISLNSHRVDLQVALVQLLIQNQRQEEAYNYYKQIRRPIPQVASLLISFGIESTQFGHYTEAVDSLRQAMTLEPNNSIVYLYLADAYERQGQFAEAIPQYEDYLAFLNAHKDAEGSDQKEVRRVTLKLAEANIRLGDIYAQAGKRADAAQCYQHALTLDLASSDAKFAGRAWFSYGQFLRRCGLSQRLVFACFLKAEALLKRAPGAELEAIVNSRQEIESALGADASAVRRDLELVTAEALTLRLDFTAETQRSQR